MQDRLFFSSSGICKCFRLGAGCDSPCRCSDCASGGGSHGGAGEPKAPLVKAAATPVAKAGVKAIVKAAPVNATTREACLAKTSSIPTIDKRHPWQPPGQEGPHNNVLVVLLVLLLFGRRRRAAQGCMHQRRNDVVLLDVRLRGRTEDCDVARKCLASD